MTLQELFVACFEDDMMLEGINMKGSIHFTRIRVPVNAQVLVWVKV